MVDRYPHASLAAADGWAPVNCSGGSGCEHIVSRCPRSRQDVRVLTLPASLRDSVLAAQDIRGISINHLGLRCSQLHRSITIPAEQILTLTYFRLQTQEFSCRSMVWRSH